jgi:hypothetical protein
MKITLDTIPTAPRASPMSPSHTNTKGFTSYRNIPISASSHFPGGMPCHVRVSSRGRRSEQARYGRQCDLQRERSCSDTGISGANSNKPWTFLCVHLGSVLALKLCNGLKPHSSRHPTYTVDFVHVYVSKSGAISVRGHASSRGCEASRIPNYLHNRIRWR